MTMFIYQKRCLFCNNVILTYTSHEINHPAINNINNICVGCHDEYNIQEDEI